MQCHPKPIAMIKFKALYYVLALLMALCLFSIIAMVLGLFAVHNKPELNPEWTTVIIIAFFKVLLLVIALSFIKRSIGMFLHHGYFNIKSANYLTIAGYTMAGSALVYGDYLCGPGVCLRLHSRDDP